jgi:hypothetical protein
VTQSMPSSEPRPGWRAFSCDFIRTGVAQGVSTLRDQIGLTCPQGIGSDRGHSNPKDGDPGEENQSLGYCWAVILPP